MKKILFIIPFIFACFSLHAQNKKEQDINAIKNMCGCYEVNFAFAETFSPTKDYKIHKPHNSSGLEWVELVENSDNKIVLQHLLITEDSTGKKDIVKHWRQDWLYENTDLYVYDKDNTWKYTKVSKQQVKGQWTQKVFQVDDSPRYEGSATWVHFDNKHFWENITDSPLPRREFTTRSDYNVLKRKNRHELTNYGWVHEQDNDKIQRIQESEKLIAQEKGINTYKKVDKSRCELAQQYWKQKKAFWAKVRTEWDTIFAKNKDLKLEKTVDKKPLFMYLFDAKVEETAEIKKIIAQFVKQ